MASNRITGSQTLAYCSKCARILAHVVVAAANSRTSRVRCTTCEDVHAYRKAQPKSDGMMSAAKRQKAEERAAALATSSFESLMQGQDLARAKPYDRVASFHCEDMLDHKTFGAGIVVRTMPGSKIEVQFREGRKVLIHEVVPA